MPQKSFTILENKVTLYNRGGGTVWHARIKLKTGEWWRFSTKQTDFEEAKEVALKEYYTTDYKHKNNLPQNTRKFKSVANYSIKRMEDELAHGGGKSGRSLAHHPLFILPEKLIPGPVTVFDGAAQCRGLSGGTGIHDATGLDTVMGRINGHGHVIGVQQCLQCHQNLLCQALLHLGTLSEETHDEVDLRQADKLITGNIGDPGSTVDGHEMMLAGTGQAYIPHLDHFVHFHLVFDHGYLGKMRVVLA